MNVLLIIIVDFLAKFDNAYLNKVIMMVVFLLKMLTLCLLEHRNCV